MSYYASICDAARFTIDLTQHFAKHITPLILAASPLLLSDSTGFCRISSMVIVQRPMVTTLLPASSFLLPPFSRRSPSRKVPVTHAYLQSCVASQSTMIMSLPSSSRCLPLSPGACHHMAACRECMSKDLPDMGRGDILSGIASHSLIHLVCLAQCRPSEHACSSPVGAQARVSTFCCLSAVCLSHRVQQLGFNDAEDSLLVLGPSVSFSRLALSFHSPYSDASSQPRTSISGLSQHCAFRGAGSAKSTLEYCSTF